MNVQTHMPVSTPVDEGVLTPSERVQTLIEQTLTLHALESASEAAHVAHQAAVKAGSPATYYLGENSDAAVQDECARGDEILAHLKILAADGTLEKCRNLLELRSTSDMKMSKVNTGFFNIEGAREKVRQLQFTKGNLVACQQTEPKHTERLRLLKHTACDHDNQSAQDTSVAVPPRHPYGPPTFLECVQAAMLSMPPFRNRWLTGAEKEHSKFRFHPRPRGGKS